MAQVYSDDPEVQAVVEALHEEFEAARDAFEADKESEEKWAAYNDAMQSLAMARKASRAGRGASIITE